MTETIEAPIETQIEYRQAQKVRLKFEGQEKTFLEVETTLATCRAFFAKHREALAAFEWRCWGWDNEIKFSHYYNEDPKSIAKAFGASGWTREHDRHSCGAINWKKQLDGMTLIIEGAESIKPKLIEEVKFATVD